MSNLTGIAPYQLKRNFLSPQFKVERWSDIEPFYKELKDRPLHSVQELEKWLRDLSELDTIINEEFGWRYIRMTCDTASEPLLLAYNFFLEEIIPHIEPFSDFFNKKIIDSPFLASLDKKKFEIFIKEVKNELEIFRQENIPLYTKLNTEEQKFAIISGEMTVHFEGKELTLQQAAVYLKKKDRSVRETIFRLINGRRLQDSEKIDSLFDLLISLRLQIATNAGFANFRDYKFKSLARFDYTVEDCMDFHQSIQLEVIPLMAELDESRAKKLNLSSLRPWDLEVDAEGKEPLHPFNNAEDLIQKSIQCFYKVRPFFGECLETMNSNGRLDVASRKGKAPGGYNYPLNESGIPFIFMNAAGLHRDLVTMMHEGGHAIHGFLTNELELDTFKNCPSEVSELASMSMELISMDHWNLFFENPDDLKRARKEQLEKSIRSLAWIAAVDKFQHWIYENKNHSVQDRKVAWINIMKQLSSPVVDWSGLTYFRESGWHAQLHIFDAPFYYIEYGMAQLGALAIWRNYKINPQKTLDQYEAALKLGHTRSIPEVYATAGIKFDFSKEYVHEIVEFVKQELREIN